MIIPTYNRAETLEKCLKALSAQTMEKSGYEIIVVDDGSTDGTADLLASLTDRFPVDLKYLWQENKGPAAARNAGIKVSDGKILLFTGDDIIPDADMLSEHLKCHGAHPENEAAVLGYTTWSDEITVTPFMRWLESSGVQFGYGELEGLDEADPGRFFYTSNVSVKKNFLTANGLFDEDFPYAAYEDTELGLRLKEKGLRLYYSKKAVGRHEHPTSLAAACARMVKVGESGEIYAKKAGRRSEPPGPDEAWAVREMKSCKFHIYYQLAKFFETRAVSGHIFRYITEYYCRLGARAYMDKNK